MNNKLPVGTRVYAWHQQWPDAAEFGTGVIVDSATTYGETTYSVQLDAGAFVGAGTIATWLDKNTYKARRQRS